MAGLFGIVKPQRVVYTNQVTNPSCKTITGFTLMGSGTLTLESGYPSCRRGLTGLKWTDNSAAGGGVYWSFTTIASIDRHDFSLDVKGPLNNTYRIYFATSLGAVAGTPFVFTTTGKWQRVHVIGAVASPAGRLVIDDNNTSQTGVVYLDGWQLVYHSTLPVFDPGYIDGDQRDCLWVGTPHASRSSRIIDSREGGQEIMLQDLGFYIDDAPGAGAPELKLHTQDYALLPGTMDLGHKVTGRSFSLVGYVVGTSLADLHTKRKALFDLVKPDLNPKSASMLVTYTSTNSSTILGTKTRIRARYAGGMSFGSVAGFQEGYRERVALRFYADDPFWYEDGEEGASLVSYILPLPFSYAIRLSSLHNWEILTSGEPPNDFTGTVYCAVALPNGHVIFGGEFTNVGSVNGDYIVDYYQGVFTNLGTGTNGAVTTLAVSPTGVLYVGGNFTSAGGVANTAYLAAWDGSVWSAVGAGAHGLAIVNALQFDQAGLLYIGGSSGAGTNGIKIWNGSTYSTPGTGTAGAVQTLKLGPDGFIYVGGLFTSAGGVSNTNMLARWTGTVWQPLGTGITTGTAVYVLEFDDGGNLYAGGNFTVVSSVSASYIAMWNGTVWSPLGSGTDGQVVVLRYLNGVLYVGGYFSTAGGISIAGEAAIWNGTTWAHLPLTLAAGGSMQDILFHQGDMYFCYDVAAVPTTSYKNPITNTGSAIAFPKITFTRTGGTLATIAYVANFTTGAVIWLNYALQNGESLTIDFAPDKRTCVSSIRGNVLGSAVLRSSAFAEFNLIPGGNDIEIYVIPAGFPTVDVSITWPLVHWALDGGVV